MYKKDLIKGTLKTILLSLLDEKGEMYGYEITQVVKQRTDDEIALTEGSLYPALHKLEANGLVSSELKIHDGRSRKYYVLTKKGLGEVKEAKASWSQFTTLMGNVLNQMQYAK